jgi:phosphatidylinositol 3,5-bisphosphate 5-phosphatase
MTNLVVDAPCFIRSKIKRSMSDGNIPCENNVPVSNCNVGENSTELLPMQQLADMREPSDSAPEISVCEPNLCSRCVNPCTKLSTRIP